MKRGAVLAGGALLVVVAFAAATRVADTRDGLVAEVILLFASLGGVSLLLYGLAANRVPVGPAGPPIRDTTRASARRREQRDLLLGSGGVAVALFLVSGLAFTGGALWAVLGLALLLPMLAGSVYLLLRFLRAG